MKFSHQLYLDKYYTTYRKKFILYIINNWLLTEDLKNKQ